MDNTANGVIKGLLGIITVFASIYAFQYGFDAGQKAGKAWSSTAANKAKK